MKKVLKAMVWLFVILVALMSAVYMWAWKSPSCYTITGTHTGGDSIIPFKDYSRVNNQVQPYVVEGRDYVIFGATHTRDPRSSEIKQVEEKWNSLQPTVALIDGRIDFFLPGIMNPVKKFGEAGKVKQLAVENDIPVYTWDLPKEILAEQYISASLKGAAYVNRENYFQTAADIDRAWKKYFPAGKDWRETSGETGLPGYLSDMMNYSNDLRNRHLVAVIKELLAKNEKVFVICGSSHAACVEPAFNSPKYEGESIKPAVSISKANNLITW